MKKLDDDIRQFLKSEKKLPLLEMEVAVREAFKRVEDREDWPWVYKIAAMAANWDLANAARKSDDLESAQRYVTAGQALWKLALATES